MIKSAILKLFGVVFTIIGGICVILLKIYSLLLDAFIHPSKKADEIVKCIGELQEWIDKKLNGVK